MDEEEHSFQGGHNASVAAQQRLKKTWGEPLDVVVLCGRRKAEHDPSQILVKIRPPFLEKGEFFRKIAMLMPKTSKTNGNRVETQKLTNKKFVITIIQKPQLAFLSIAARTLSISAHTRSHKLSKPEKI